MILVKNLLHIFNNCFDKGKLKNNINTTIFSIYENKYIFVAVEILRLTGQQQANCFITKQALHNEQFTENSYPISEWYVQSKHTAGKYKVKLATVFKGSLFILSMVIDTAPN